MSSNLNPATRFLLDANIFIEAQKRYYAMDLCPGFWERLLHFGTEKRIASIDKVQAEFTKGSALEKWSKETPPNFFLSTNDESTAQLYSDIMTGVHGNTHYKSSAVADFARGADGWLIAHAKVYQYVVVTHEVYNAEAKKKVPIPNVCEAFDVPYLNTFEMLRQLGVHFR